MSVMIAFISLVLGIIALWNEEYRNRYWWVGGLLLAISFCSFGFIGDAMQEQRHASLAKFVKDHRCVVIGEMSAGWNTPPKIGYKCDDGKEYWK